MDRSDVLVGVGVALIGVAVYFMSGWPGVLAWCGLLLLAAGMGEARRRKA